MIAQRILMCLLFLVMRNGLAQEKTDRHYPTKHFDYVSVQNQIDELAKDKQVSAYDLAKAQAWLNSSKYEMWRNDAHWWSKEAFEEAQRIIVAIKNKDVAALVKTNSLKVKRLVAQDFWAEAEVLRQAKQVCAQILVARAQVELVHAAYEVETTSWQDASPQLNLVKDLLLRAKDCKD